MAEISGGGRAQGAKLEQKWNEDLKAYTEKYPEEGEEFKQLISCELPKDWDATLPRFTPDDKVPPPPPPPRMRARTHARTCNESSQMAGATMCSRPGHEAYGLRVQCCGSIERCSFRIRIKFCTRRRWRRARTRRPC